MGRGATLYSLIGIFYFVACALEFSSLVFVIFLIFTFVFCDLFISHQRHRHSIVMAIFFCHRVFCLSSARPNVSLVYEQYFDILTIRQIRYDTFISLSLSCLPAGRAFLVLTRRFAQYRRRL